MYYLNFFYSPLIQVTTWDKRLLLVGSCVHVFSGLCVIVCLSIYV